MTIAVYIHGHQDRLGRMGRALTTLIATDSCLSREEKLEKADVVIDFTTPAALAPLLQRCLQHQKPVVIGTTGYLSTDEQLIQKASEYIPLFVSPNFSLGMAACLEVARLLATHLKGLCQIEIIEAHHQSKKDNPSGTARALAQALGQPDLAIHSIRAGDIVGDHTVLLTLSGERVELKHQVQSREAFAKGALLAAQFLKHKPPGVYSMKDLV